MADDIKKDIWQLDVNRQSVLKVAFSEPVTREDAILLYMEEEFEDIIDEEDHGIDVVGAR